MIPLFLLQAPTLDLSLMPSGLFDRIKGYMPYGLKLSETKPSGLRKAPDVAKPRYGTIKVGKHEFLALLDGEDKLYVDENGDGDLTNDPSVNWTPKTYPDGKKEWSGTAKVDLPYGGKTTPVTLGIYSTGGSDGLGYYADFALSGKATLGGKSYDAIYSDPTGTWDGKTGVLMIDKDANGTFHPGLEFNRAGQPFNVGGTTYEMRGLALVVSDKKVEERTLENSAPADPNLANGLVAGKRALPFEATTLSGRKVSLKESYKGKVVLVDFWATWCGPCMREVPNVVKAYGAYHDKGFEVLGVSLDREKAEEQIASVTAKNSMPWEQIYDGKYFDARIAKQYSIKAIPATYLIDGDTGVILASGDGARGAKLGPAVERALATKRG